MMCISMDEFTFVLRKFLGKLDPTLSSRGPSHQNRRDLVIVSTKRRFVILIWGYPMY